MHCTSSKGENRPSLTEALALTLTALLHKFIVMSYVVRVRTAGNSPGQRAHRQCDEKGEGEGDCRRRLHTSRRILWKENRQREKMTSRSSRGKDNVAYSSCLSFDKGAK